MTLVPTLLSICPFNLGGCALISLTFFNLGTRALIYLSFQPWCPRSYLFVLSTLVPTLLSICPFISSDLSTCAVLPPYDLGAHAFTNLCLLFRYTIDFCTITILSNGNTQWLPPLHTAAQANIIRASFMRIVESSV